MAYVAREEQEVIISYDRELDEWHYYGDVPPLNRKWRDLVEPTREIVEENGIVALLEGKITGTVVLSKKRTNNLSEEQRKIKSERMKKLRQRQINSKASNVINSID